MRIRIIPKLLGNSPSKRSKTTYNNLTKILRQRWHSMSFLCPGPAWICCCSGGPAYNHTSTRFSGPAEGGGWGPAVLMSSVQLVRIPSYPIAFLSCNLLKELPRQGQQHPLSARVQGAGENVGSARASAPIITIKFQ